jgi:hypothetical protein
MEAQGMSESFNHGGAAASGPPPMSAYDWMCYALSRRPRAYFQLRNEHYLYNGFNFDAVGAIRGEGEFKVAVRVTGNATVADRELFVRHHTLLPEKRERFSKYVLAHVDQRMTALRYFCLYHLRSTKGPAWPEFYRQVTDDNRVWRCECDPNLVDLARDVRDTFQPIYGATLAMLLITQSPCLGK